MGWFLANHLPSALTFAPFPRDRDHFTRLDRGQRRDGGGSETPAQSLAARRVTSVDGLSKYNLQLASLILQRADSRCKRPGFTMDLITCKCANCDAKLGRLANLWTQIGKKYLTPAAQLEDDGQFRVSTSGSVRQGATDTLVGGW